ncbi:MAG: OmpA family protein [Bacteroidetes bacterium]|nr:OmpA family protein [Bacteroidota bacterium]
MHRTYFLHFFWLFWVKMAVQDGNLVLNPGFEKLRAGGKYPICSYAQNDMIFDESVADWNTSGGMTPDLIIWKSDKYGDCFFPKPHGGENALGLITYLPGMDLGRLYDFHEAVQGKLRFPLMPGQQYEVSFFIQQADSVAINHLQVLYGEKQQIFPTAAGNLGICFTYNSSTWLDQDEIQPQVLFKEPVVTRQGEWLQIRDTFVPDRPFLYFIVGNFFKDKDTPTTLENSDEIGQFNLAQTGFAQKKKRLAYYLVDDFSVVPIEKKKAPVASTIATELKKKKSYIFKNVNFETGKWDLLPGALPELDGLADFLQKNPEIKVEIGGHTDDIGSEEANRVLSENRAEAVYNYLISKKIAVGRLDFKGYGEGQPVAPNDTPVGRLQNRRVECRVR